MSIDYYKAPPKPRKPGCEISFGGICNEKELINIETSTFPIGQYSDAAINIDGDYDQVTWICKACLIVAVKEILKELQNK